MSKKKETYSRYPLQRKSETEFEIEYEKVAGISLEKYCKRYPLSTTLILVLPLLGALAISCLLYWLGVCSIMPLWLWFFLCVVIGSIMSQTGCYILLSRWHRNKYNKERNKITSNQIFCKVNKEMCDAVKAIAGDRIVVDCGADRGIFASMYDGKVLSIDIHQPDEPLSFIIQKNAEHYCFPRNSIPIFIRPCHSNFVHNTILKNRNKFDKAIYVSLPKNLDGDLDNRFYKITQYSEWEGEEGERIYLVELNKPKESFGYLSGKIIHFADPMLSCFVEIQEQEFKKSVESPLEDRGILIDGLRLTLTDMYPSGEKYDYLFFDYGNISIRNSLMESFCREIVRDADMYPNRTYIVVSTFTSCAMKDAKEDFGKDLPNVFLSISDFVTFHKRLNQLA